MSGDALYAAMVAYVEARGWYREGSGSGWWLHEDGFEETIGRAVEECFDSDAIDTREEPTA